MNGFEKHGIKHLSASSINLWTNAPDVWVATYLFKKRGSMSAPAMRGICTEDAVSAFLTGEMQKEAALEKALAKFDKMFFLADEKISKERAMIEPCMELTLQDLEQYGKPEFPEEGQVKISITAKTSDFEIPVIGYLDFVFPDHGVVIDLKTTGRIPSTMSAEHQLQRAIYQQARGNQIVKFLYVSSKKTSLLEDGDPTEILAIAKKRIARLEKFLRSGSADEIKDIIPVNPNSFYWNGSEDTREELYGF
tara:strand:- start:2897 stop:3646 length:750 start_codon:yes stop_codon:yes gene_type:complete